MIEKNADLAPVNYSSAQNYAQGNYVQGTYAQPAVTSQPQVYNVASTPMHQVRVKPVGIWGDSICDWPKNLFPSCYCACCACYGIYILAQMSQKLNISNFQTVLWSYGAVCFICFILQIVFPNSGVLIWIPFLCAHFFAIYIRIKISMAENLRENGGPCGECCIGFWCSSCSISQMARHVYGYSKVLDGDGDPYRPDAYASTETHGIQHV